MKKTKNFDKNLIKIYQFNYDLENPNEILENIKQGNFYKYLIEYCEGNSEKLFYYIQNHCFGYDNIINNGFVKIQGFIIDFSKLMKKYLVKFNYDGCYKKYYSFNKTLLRNSFYNKNEISEILDYNGKL